MRDTWRKEESMPWECSAHKFMMASPEDMSGLESLIDQGTFAADEVLCVIAKTEGNGRVNDFSRPLAHRAFRDCLVVHTGLTAKQVDERVMFCMSGGCEGVITPHATVFVRRPSSASPTHEEPRLTLGIGFTRDLLPEEVGTIVQVELVCEAVRAAQADAHIASVDQVHYVQVKCPLLTSERIAEARLRKMRTVTEDTLRSMGYSNGSSALGIAMGLGELSGPIDPASICTDPDLYTTRGGSSSGIELMRCQALVVGNADGMASSYVSGHQLLTDLIDADGVRAALRSVGVAVEGTLPEDQRDRIVNVFGKGQVSLDGRVRGRRSTLLTDSDLNTRPARAVLGAVIASVVGDPAIYASAGWGYHQGPAGGGMVAVIAKA